MHNTVVDKARKKILHTKKEKTNKAHDRITTLPI